MAQLCIAGRLLLLQWLMFLFCFGDVFGDPTHQCQASGPPPRQKHPRRRDKCGSKLVKLKVWLAQSSSISRTGHGLIHPFAVTQRFLDPIDA